MGIALGRCICVWPQQACDHSSSAAHRADKEMQRYGPEGRDAYLASTASVLDCRIQNRRISSLAGGWYRREQHGLPFAQEPAGAAMALRALKSGAVGILR